MLSLLVCRTQNWIKWRFSLRYQWTDIRWPRWRHTRRVRHSEGCRQHMPLLLTWCSVLLTLTPFYCMMMAGLYPSPSSPILHWYELILTRNMLSVIWWSFVHSRTSNKSIKIRFEGIDFVLVVLWSLKLIRGNYFTTYAFDRWICRVKCNSRMSGSVCDECELVLTLTKPYVTRVFTSTDCDCIVCDRGVY